MILCYNQFLTEFTDQLFKFIDEYAEYGVFRLMLGTKLTVALYKPEYVEVCLTA